MRLLTLHKVVIAAAIGVSLLFALWACWMWSHAHRASTTHLVLALLAAAVTGALAVYLRYFMGRTRRQMGVDRSVD